jgi:DNA primase
MHQSAFISDRSIQDIREINISDVVRNYITLDSKGSARCPFHAEKSPSFRVNDRKGIFKCFGCGKAGDAIHFVMEMDKLNFIESIEKIASITGVKLQYESVADPEAFEASKKKKLSLIDLVGKVVAIYRQTLWDLPADNEIRKYISSRKLTDDDITEWQLGWATTDWKYLSSTLINDGQYEPASQLGLIRRNKNDDGNYDALRSRIIFPITNHQGQYVGLAGRYIQVDPADQHREYAKYINPPENELYHKSNVLYGLSQAAKSIKELKHAILVEGYLDVITLHKNGDTNAIGSCGTALTTEQAKLLKRYTSTVMILRDGDAAGSMASVKDLPILLREGFKVEIGILPTDKDPDDFIREQETPKPVRDLLSESVPHPGGNIQDAILWRAQELVRAAAGDLTEEANARQLILELLANIQNAFIRNNYFDAIARKYKWKKPADYLKRLEALATPESAQDMDAGSMESDGLDKMPEWMDRDEFISKGYCAVKKGNRMGYYTFSASGKVEITNFLIYPLFHVFAGKDSRHLIQIDNGKYKAVLDVESKVMVSIDLMQACVVGHGAFIFYGNKNHLLRIATDLLQQFPKCYEVKFLGWQSDKFFSWVNKSYVVDKGLEEYDNWGILKHNDKNFLIPAACEAYRELQQTGEDPYEQDRPLIWIKPPFNFDHWADLMHKVYQDKGTVAIAFIFLTAFRDIIYDIDNNCPHLYGYGERTAGKSKWAESIGAVFFHNRAALNLNSGTDYAFFKYMERFKNTPALLNEFDEKVIKPEWFQAIKGIFDGESRQRGKLTGGKMSTETMHISSTLVLTGQYLCTMDDNSIVSRSIIEAFSERDYTEQEKLYYQELKDAEGEGITGLISEVLQYRKEFKMQYKDLFNQFLSRWRTEINPNDVNFNQRIMQNWVHLYTCYHIMHKYIKLPSTPAVFYDYCKDKAIYWSNFIRSSDTLSDFWNTLSFLLDRGDITDGWDYKIESLTHVMVRDVKTKKDFTHHFPEPTKVLFIRLNNIHKHYEQVYRQRTGKTAMTLENLLHYFSSRKYFIGSTGKTRFIKWAFATHEQAKQVGLTTKMEPVTGKEKQYSITSAHMFLYDSLGIDLERSTMESGGGEEPPPTHPDLPF